MIFDNLNSFTQTAGTKALVSTMDLPEAEMVDVITFLKEHHGYSEADPETQEQAADADEEETETEEITDAGNDAEPSLLAIKYGEYVNRAWVPGYEEVGDTAFITFDKFDIARENYYDPGIDRDQPEDTIDLIIYANSQIKREGSPIRNIVLDLSQNSGGDSIAAIFVISWFLGEADIALRDVFTGAETNAMYQADVNLDGRYPLFRMAPSTIQTSASLLISSWTSPSPITIVLQWSNTFVN